MAFVVEINCLVGSVVSTVDWPSRPIIDVVHKHTNVLIKNYNRLGVLRLCAI